MYSLKSKILYIAAAGLALTLAACGGAVKTPTPEVVNLRGVVTEERVDFGKYTRIYNFVVLTQLGEKTFMIAGDRGGTPSLLEETLEKGMCVEIPEFGPEMAAQTQMYVGQDQVEIVDCEN